MQKHRPTFAIGFDNAEKVPSNIGITDQPLTHPPAPWVKQTSMATSIKGSGGSWNPRSSPSLPSVCLTMPEMKWYPGPAMNGMACEITIDVNWGSHSATHRYAVKAKDTTASPYTCVSPLLPGLSNKSDTVQPGPVTMLSNRPFVVPGFQGRSRDDFARPIPPLKSFILTIYLIVPQ